MNLGRKGQSAVEYILLLAVVVALTMGVFKSKAFQDFFGDDSAFFAELARGIESNYRYGLTLDDTSDNPHPGFYVSGGSRFFSGRNAYPPE